MILKLNQDLRTPYGFKMKDEIIEVIGDSENVPLDLFWRNRLKDSAVDNCVSIVEETKKSKIK
jgi:hypothetical protein